MQSSHDINKTVCGILIKYKFEIFSENEWNCFFKYLRNQALSIPQNEYPFSLFSYTTDQDKKVGLFNLNC